MGWFQKRREQRQERALHNDRDFDCRYWWGDRNGSAVGVMNERCKVCNPVKKKPYVITHSHSAVAGTGGI